MGFTGIARDTQRADVINYLHTLSDKPIDLPKAAAK
jgi:cytochrome c